MRVRSPIQQWGPLLYFGIAMALAAALLPTALRPPPQQPPTSAQLSPDAPPDDNQVLISELGQGRSATAGSGLAVPGGLDGEVKVPPVNLPPRKGRCWGDPPRQTESIYAPPCVGAWVGENGGSTWRGVSATEVRWAVVVAGNGYEGPADGPVPAGEEEDALKRTYRVWQQDINEHFEHYGRRLRIFIVTAGTLPHREAARGRAAARKAFQEYGVMGMTLASTATPSEDEALKLGMVVFGGSHHEIEYFKRSDPMAWAFVMDGTRLTRILGELYCKQLHDKPVSFSGDPSMQGQPRRLGVLSYHDASYQGYEGPFEDEIARCGGRSAFVQAYNVDDTFSEQFQVMTKMRGNGVTTIVCLCDGFSPIVFANSADQQGYYPEWVHPGSAGISENGTAWQYSHATQWKNSIGIDSTEMNGSRESGEDGYRAYKRIDPDGAPEDGPYLGLLHVAGAIQLAGPKLTPVTIKDGLLKRWPSKPPVPNWTIGGGYGPGDWTYSDYVSLVWWDPLIARPQSSSRGAYRYVYDGKRFKYGEIPREPIPFFKEGITQPPAGERM